ncbi:MAG: hypothetical protein L0Y56_21280 [Nitrospira sp.]|nr:hypothetical protein [Nitrospira sp.]
MKVFWPTGNVFLPEMKERAVQLLKENQFGYRRDGIYAVAFEQGLILSIHKLGEQYALNFHDNFFRFSID